MNVQAPEVPLQQDCEIGQEEEGVPALHTTPVPSVAVVPQLPL
jgi:hypothetical protein